MNPLARVATSTCPPANAARSVRNVPRPATGQTFIARARVAREKWERFEAATQRQGTDRSKVINEFVDWYLRERGATLPSRPDKAVRNEGDQ